MNWLRRLLTREVTLIYFSDGDAFIEGRHTIPAKPPTIPAQRIKARVWRWKR